MRCLSPGATAGLDRNGRRRGTLSEARGDEDLVVGGGRWGGGLVVGGGRWGGGLIAAAAGGRGGAAGAGGGGHFGMGRWMVVGDMG